MIERYDPFARMFSLRQMMDRLFEDAVVIPHDGGTSEASSAALNVYEDGENLVVEALMPGIQPDNIEVTVEGGTLTIRGSVEVEDERPDRNYLIREHRRMAFVRSMRLPDTVDTENVQASFENGVLRLVFPRAEQAKPRRIAVTGDGRHQVTAGGETGTRTAAEAGSQPSMASEGQTSPGARQTPAEQAGAGTGTVSGATPSSEPRSSGRRS